MSDQSAEYERFVRWYLRFNGYFTIENFIVHAGDDQSRISDEKIGSHTETDILAVRMPYSKEVTGKLFIANHEPLVNNITDRVDIVVAEVKTKNSNKPNRVWKSEDLFPIQYLVRFIGHYKHESQIGEVASALLSKYIYEDRDCRIRYIIV